MQLSVAFLVAVGLFGAASAVPISSEFNNEVDDFLMILPESDNDEVYQPISPKSTLDNDVQEFVNLVPSKTIHRIVVKRYIFDSQFRRAVKYIRSEQFYKLIRKLHNIPEYNELLGMLEALGLNVQSTIRTIHEAIKFPGRLMIESEIEERSLVSVIAEIKATIPIGQMKALYQHKLETSPDFKKLVEVIRSEKFQAVTNALFADVDFQDFLRKVQSYGVNLRPVSEFFLTVFGITTPSGIVN